MSKHYDYYQDDEYVTDGAPPPRQQTSTRTYQPQRRAAQPAPPTRPRASRTTRTTGDVNHYVQPQPIVYDEDGDDQDDTYYSEQNMTQRLRPRITESQTPVRASMPARQSTGQVRRVIRQYPDDEPMYEQQRPQQRPRQREQTYVEPVRRSMYTPDQRHREEKLHPDQQSRRSLIGRGLAMLAGATTIVLIGANVGSVLQASIDQYDHQQQEGIRGYRDLSLVCGHSDSVEHPTELRAFVRENGIISVEEIPGGGTKTIRTDTTSVHTTSDHDYSHIDLRFFPQKVGKLYRIRFRVKVMPVSTLAAPEPQNFYLIDNGKGYFQLQQ